MFLECVSCFLLSERSPIVSSDIENFALRFRKLKVHVASSRSKKKAVRIARAARKRIRSGGAAKLLSTNGAQVEAKRSGKSMRASKYRGVSLQRSSGRWQAYLWREGRRQYLGLHSTEKLASGAYEQALGEQLASKRQKTA